MKLKFSLFFLILTFLFSNTKPANIYAIENPLAVPNNRFGIHIINESDLADAANLVNSHGDWGYVTLVIRKDERDTSRWQNFFDKMRRLHLIPIVRMATIQQRGGWEKPNLDEIDGWVSFFNSLNWVTKNRYVVVGNEPNHAAEWGGEVNPEEYANYLSVFSQKLKDSNPDYFILPAGFDASAPNGKETMSEDLYLERMFNEKPNFFNYLDGWTTHSYPNPAFSGSQDEAGRGTIRTFDWEIQLLEKLGVEKNLPIFITETGWAHDMDGLNRNLINTDSVSSKLKTAYQTAWNNEKVVAVTPFVLNYQDEPFNKFSWKRADGSFYPFYNEIKSLSKTKGAPVQIVSVDILAVIIPPIIPVDMTKTGVVIAKNEGQSIWDGSEKILSHYKGFEIEIKPKVLINNIEPGKKTLAIIAIK